MVLDKTARLYDLNTAVVANVYSSSAAASGIVIAFYVVVVVVVVGFEICTELIHFKIKVKSWSKYKCNLQKINWND